MTAAINFFKNCMLFCLVVFTESWENR